MEKYISRINNRVLRKHDEKGQKRIKTTLLAVGGTSLAVGLAGFLAAFITFVVLFLDNRTDDSMVAWMVAVPFMVVIVIGSIVTRIGDKLLTEGYNEELDKKKVKE